MTMKNPPHPGEIIRELCLEPLGLTVTQAAQGTWRDPQDPFFAGERSRGPFPGNGRQAVAGLWPQS